MQQYLQNQRSGGFKWSGKAFLVNLQRLPCRILSVERQRYDELCRTNHKKSHLFTDYTKGNIYRCPLPNCGGMTINYANIKRALVSHNKAYHRTLKNVQIAYCIEMGKSWDYLSYPADPPGGGGPRGVSWDLGSQDRSQDYGRSDAEERSAVPAAATRDEDPAIIPCEISPLRTALEVVRGREQAELEAALPTAETHPQGEKLGSRTGVFAVSEGGLGGGGVVRELSAVFVQGENLTTVQQG